MASANVSKAPIEQQFTRYVSVRRLAAATGVAAVLIFILCWLGTFLSVASPTHAYVALFTNAERQSQLALIEGSTWSLLFGFFSGAVLAALYNLFAPLGRR